MRFDWLDMFLGSAIGQSVGRSPTSERGISMPSIIGADLVVRGELQMRGELQIDGRVEGSVVCRSVTISEGGFVLGDLTCDLAMVRGQIDGSITAEKLVVSASARLTGCIAYDRLSIDAGARLVCTCKPQGDPSQARAPVRLLPSPDPSLLRLPKTA